MGLETGTGIGDLVPTNPLSTDAVSAGDDHIRLIKTVMQSITGNFRSIQTFTTFSSTWTRPAGIKHILIVCIGGGGGGGGGTVGGYSGGGGSSGAIAIKWLDVTAIASAQVIIGTGGPGGSIGSAGSDGLSTTFTTGGGTVFHCIAAQGKPGVAYYVGGAVLDRSASTGDIIFTGTAGQPGLAKHPTENSYGGNGGGAGGSYANPAKPNSGGGGEGGYSQAGVASAGGAGGTGYCIVFEFGW